MTTDLKSLRPCLRLLPAVLAMATCGCREADPSAEIPPPSAEVAAAAAAPPLVILTWDEYFSPEVVASFEEEHGITVEFVTFSNLDEMEGLLRSRPADFDLLVASGGVVADLIELQFLQPIQRDLIPLFENLDERFLGSGFDPENQFSVPYMWGTTLIAYRADKIEEPKTSWKALWDETYRGRMLMLDDGFDIYAAALLASGHDLNSQEVDEIEEATEELLNLAEQQNARFVDIFEIRERLLSGECWIAMGYSSDAAVLAEEEENIDYFIPDEGAPLWLDSFVIPRESRNSEAAHLFLDYFCRAEVAAANSNELWCASANREARPFLDEEVLEDPTLYLEEAVMARCRPESQSSPARQLQVNKGLKQIFERVRELGEKPVLSLLIWEKYLAPELLKRFEKSAGARVELTEVENSEQLKQELASRPDAFDVVVADESTLKELVDLRLLGKLDGKKLCNKFEDNGHLPHLPTGADDCHSVPYLWGLTVLAGRSDKIGNTEHSWNLLWREDLRISLLDEPVDVVWMALLALGYDPASATKEQVDEAVVRLQARFPDFTGAMKDLYSGLDALEAGELDLVMTYNGDAISRAASNPGIEVIVPREGAPVWLDSFAVSRDTDVSDLAHQFIDFMSTDEASALTANELRYATPNPAALPLMDSALLGNPALYPAAEVMKKCGFVNFPDEIQKHVNQSVVKLVTGSRFRTAENSPIKNDATFVKAGERENSSAGR